MAACIVRRSVFDVGCSKFWSGLRRALSLCWPILLLCAVVPPMLAQTKPEAPPGRRFALTDGPLFVPERFKAGTDGVDLTIHLHGAPMVVEKCFVRAQRSGVLVNVTLPGLSGVYTERFRDTNVFHRLLEETRAKLQMQGAASNAVFRTVTLSSFSAGFGGVRELLKDPIAFGRIDALVMADSIYAGYAGDPARHEVDPAKMEGFLKFAREAGAGRKWFIVSHSAQRPEGYASTTETADYLLAQLGGKQEPTTQLWPGSELKLESQFGKGRLEIYGFAGDSPADHMKHLHNLWTLLERVRE